MKTPEKTPGQSPENPVTAVLKGNMNKNSYIMARPPPDLPLSTLFIRVGGQGVNGKKREKEKTIKTIKTKKKKEKNRRRQRKQNKRTKEQTEQQNRHRGNRSPSANRTDRKRRGGGSRATGQDRLNDKPGKFLNRSQQ